MGGSGRLIGRLYVRFHWPLAFVDPGWMIFREEAASGKAIHREKDLLDCHHADRLSERPVEPAVRSGGSVRLPAGRKQIEANL